MSSCEQRERHNLLERVMCQCLENWTPAGKDIGLSLRIVGSQGTVSLIRLLTGGAG